MTTTKRYTYKSLKADLINLNAKLDARNHPYRFVIGSRNNYTAIDLSTLEQMATHCCERMLIGGTPKECLNEAHAYMAKYL